MLFFVYLYFFNTLGHAFCVRFAGCIKSHLEKSLLLRPCLRSGGARARPSQAENASMRRTVLRALVCCVVVICLSPVYAQQQTQQKVSRAQILITPENATSLHLMEVDLCHGQMVPGKFFITELTEREIAHIRNLGFQVNILIEDVIAHNRTEHIHRNTLSCQQVTYNYPVPANFELGSMGGYLTYPEILDALDLMQIYYPHLISTRQRVGTDVTHQGRPLFWVRISDNPTVDEAEPEVLYTALHHAREPMSVMQMIYYMWYLLEHYGKDPEVTYLVNNTELYFIPCINPDGYLYNQSIAPDGGGMWRKNMRDNDGDGVFDERYDGVDLNRNYSFQWGLDNKGSSGNISSQVYRGPEAFSEPEVRAVKTFVEERNFFIALNYHSYGNYFIYPWGFTEDTNPDIHIFKNYGELMALDNGYQHGTAMETVGYPTNGSSDDWMYADQGVYAMTPEIGDGDYGFWPPQSQIIPLSQASLKNNLALAHLPHQYALATEINRGFFTDKTGTLDVRVKRYGKQFGDMALTVMSLSGGLQIDGNIQEISIEEFEEQMFAVDYILDDTAQGGDPFSFVLILDNGYFEYRDTITKIFAGETLAFIENGADLTQWGPTGTWGVTSEISFSGATCLTDSPFGNYGPNAFNVLQMADPIDLRNALHAILEFQARWEIEELIDYAQVQISTDGISYHALCGQYTHRGSIFQVLEPLYDGIQTEWVKEHIDLSDYIGTEVYIRFVLISDAHLHLDGYYVDDLRVYVYESGDPTSAIPSPELPGNVRVWPNPAGDDLWIAADMQGSSAARHRIAVTNILGIEMHSEPVYDGQTIYLGTSAWPSGLYLVHLLGDGQVLHTRRVVVE